ADVTMEKTIADQLKNTVQEEFDAARVAALMQILAAESPATRRGLAKYLAGVPHLDATRALAKLAIYSPEVEVRSAAVEGLQLRRERNYTSILLEGLQYPLPEIAKRAAEAVVGLQRKDLVPQLVELLDEPDPRLPIAKDTGGKEPLVVREVV